MSARSGHQTRKSTEVRATPHKDLGIESLRGLAIILMVSGHVIGSNANLGMRVADDSVWRFFYSALVDIRMPLFAALSGFVYALRPVASMTNWRSMMRGKVRRLLVPLATVGTIFYFMQMIVPGTNNTPAIGDYWRLFIFDYVYFWFLQAIFVVFLIAGLLGVMGHLETFAKWCMLIAAASALFILVAIPGAVNFFSLNGVLLLLPFFLLGYGLQRFHTHLEMKVVLVLLASMFVISYSMRVSGILTGRTLYVELDRLLSIAVGVSAVSLLVLKRKFICARPLAVIGPFAFGVYLLHSFGVAGSRIVLSNTQITSELTIFTISLIVAVSLPIFIEKLFGHIGIISWSVFGRRPNPRANPGAVPGNQRGLQRIVSPGVEVASSSSRPW